MSRPESDPWLEAFGMRLRAIREKRGMSQQALGAAAGLQWTQVSRYERGRNVPSGDRVVALARALRTTPDYLLIGTERQHERLPLRNAPLYERFVQLDRLPRRVQRIALEVLDALIARHGTVKRRAASPRS